MSDLDLRRAYADEIVALAGTDWPPLRAAFAAVLRERFVGPGPWKLLSAGLRSCTGGSSMILKSSSVLTPANCAGRSSAGFLPNVS